MILAAGRGQRLRPLTDQTPKPLLEVAGKPLIAHHLDALAAAGFKQVVINLAWLGEQIRQALGDGQRWNLEIRYSPEPDGALETAGGIIQALPVLGPEPFVIISGDVFCDYPLNRLQALAPGTLGHLVLVDNPDHHPGGDFRLDEHGRLHTGQPALTYSGIAILHPELFQGLPPQRMALRPLFNQAIAGKRLTGERHAGLWSDVGTPQRLAIIRDRLARGPN